MPRSVVGRCAWGRWTLVGTVLALGLWSFVVPEPGRAQAVASLAVSLPTRLSDQEFWRIVEDFSEPNGFFQSENLVGNERPLQYVVPALKRRTRGGVYLGVAPDQNFTYIVALEPALAFIVDIRRGNLLEHLMYKAIIELSRDRADFLARLFSRPRPLGLDDRTSVAALIEAYLAVPASEPYYADNLQDIIACLVKTHGFGLSDDDQVALASIYRQFYNAGPELRYSLGGALRNMPDYAEMMTSTDLEGQPRSYLSSEEPYRWLKDFESRNLLVPVVGDFAGPKTLRSVARYIAERGGVINAFYTSNVEQYLFRNAVAARFYENVAALPIDQQSIFLRSAMQRNVIDPIGALLKEYSAGRLVGYMDVSSRGDVR